MKKKAWILGFLGAGILSLALVQSAGAGFIQGTRVRTEHPSPFHVAVSPDGSANWLYAISRDTACRLLM